MPQPKGTSVPDARLLARRVLDFVTSRWFVKGAFFVFFVGASVQLLRFASWARGEGEQVSRPEAVAGILPVGHFTSFFAWLKGGGWDTLLPAGLVIILASIAVSLIFKRALCGWICPLGTLWEAASEMGRRLFRLEAVRVPRWLDTGMRGLRYALGALIFVWLASVSLEEALWFREFPYMWVADIKIIESWLGPVFLAVFAGAFIASIFLGPVWCRWLCPVGALYSTIGGASACTVCRDHDNCIHCNKCNQVCHAGIDVMNSGDVRALECDGCMDCVRACPVESCLEPRLFRRVIFPAWAWPVGVVALWLGIYGIAVATGNWYSPIPPEVFRDVINSGVLEQSSWGPLQ